jgi:hypothetical protein
MKYVQKTGPPLTGQQVKALQDLSVIQVLTVMRSAENTHDKKGSLK